MKIGMNLHLLFILLFFTEIRFPIVSINLKNVEYVKTNKFTEAERNIFENNSSL